MQPNLPQYPQSTCRLSNFGLLCFVVSLLCFSRESSVAQDMVRAQLPALRSASNHIAWGGSIADGDGTLGLGGGQAMFNMMYSHSFTPALEGEFAVHYMPVQYWLKPPGWYEDFRYITLTWIFDGSLMVQPFAGGTFLQGFRIGGGLSARYLRALSTQYIGNSLSHIGTDTTFRPNTQVANYAVNTSIGANIKLDYLVPLSPRVDIGFRAQVVLLFFPFEGVIVQGSTFYTGRGGLGSAGVYLRLNW
jgi:hypothetical protein